jgi:hypothetical protein
MDCHLRAISIVESSSWSFWSNLSPTVEEARIDQQECQMDERFDLIQDFDTIFGSQMKILSEVQRRQ